MKEEKYFLVRESDQIIHASGFMFLLTTSIVVLTLFLLGYKTGDSQATVRILQHQLMIERNEYIKSRCMNKCDWFMKELRENR